MYVYIIFMYMMHPISLPRVTLVWSNLFTQKEKLPSEQPMMEFDVFTNQNEQDRLYDDLLSRLRLS